MEGTLNCNFDNDTCGYSFESSNLKWVIYRKEIVSEEDTIAEVPLNSKCSINNNKQYTLFF